MELEKRNILNWTEKGKNWRGGIGPHGGYSRSGLVNQKRKIAGTSLGEKKSVTETRCHTQDSKERLGKA